MFTLLTDETRKARKAHRCIWCGEPINPGDSYRYQSGVFEGDMQGNHWHHECVEEAAEYGNELEDGFSAYEHSRGTSEIVAEEKETE